MVSKKEGNKKEGNKKEEVPVEHDRDEGSGTRIARKGSHKSVEAEPTASATLGVTAKLWGAVARLNVRATGLYGGALLSGIIFVVALTHPTASPYGPALIAVVAFVAGMFTHAIVAHGRLNDALREKENYRLELQKMAKAKAEVEERFLTHRLSSDGPAVKQGRAGRKG